LGRAFRKKVAGQGGFLWQNFRQPQDFALLSCELKNFDQIAFLPLAASGLPP
jgi:hypothetical protein